MEFSELVKIRRSVRAYTDEAVKEEDIKTIIECALQAPSWRNSETGRYYVALGKDAIEEVYNDLPDFNKNNTRGAAYIVATFKKGFSGYAPDGPTKAGDIWGGYDLGLQNAYLCFKASELGYDTLIMGLRDEDRLREYFVIPEDEIMLPVIAIGKRNQTPTDKPRKKLEEVLIIK